eukprot:scaffold138581_cov27-Tisochrysis_lutea.AAC.2
MPSQKLCMKSPSRIPLMMRERVAMETSISFAAIGWLALAFSTSADFWVSGSSTSELALPLFRHGSEVSMARCAKNAIIAEEMKPAMMQAPQRQTTSTSAAHPVPMRCVDSKSRMRNAQEINAPAAKPEMTISTSLA